MAVCDLICFLLTSAGLFSLSLVLDLRSSSSASRCRGKVVQVHSMLLFSQCSLTESTFNHQLSSGLRNIRFCPDQAELCKCKPKMIQIPCCVEFSSSAVTYVVKKSCYIMVPTTSSSIQDDLSQPGCLKFFESSCARSGGNCTFT